MKPHKPKKPRNPVAKVLRTLQSKRVSDKRRRLRELCRDHDVSEAIKTSQQGEAS